MCTTSIPDFPTCMQGKSQSIANDRLQPLACCRLNHIVVGEEWKEVRVSASPPLHNSSEIINLRNISIQQDPAIYETDTKCCLSKSSKPVVITTYK